jgi:predicted methyltransferase
LPDYENAGFVSKADASVELRISLLNPWPHGIGPQNIMFLVPLNVTDEAVQRIRDGSITGIVHDPTSARLVEK